MPKPQRLLITDLDGTAILNREDAMPSSRLINAIKAAEGIIRVSVATGRSIEEGGEVIRALCLKTPCIISGGTQILDPLTEKTLWEKNLDQYQVYEILRISQKYHYQLLFGGDTLLTEDAILENQGNGHTLVRVAYLMAVEADNVDKIMEQFTGISEVAAHSAQSWTEGRFDIHVTHCEATKSHALEILLSLLNIDKNDVIAVGDSNNDMPLFNGAGYKVAVENATDELKSYADLIIGSPEDDGLAEYIEKLIHGK